MVDSSVGGNRKVVDYRHNSLADGVNKAILVNILGESLKGKGAETICSGDEVTEGSVDGSLGAAGVDVGLGCQEDLGVSSGGRQGAGNQGGEGNKGLHSAT